MSSFIRHLKTIRTAPLMSLFASLLLALVVFWATSGLEANQRSTLAVAAFMISAWILESIPFGAVALVPALAFPLLGVSSLSNVVGHYATPTVALFFGGFLLASAIERSRVHERLSHLLLVRTRLGARRALLGVLLIAVILSMWISNTSTAIMIVPLAMALGRSLSRPGTKRCLSAPFALGAAYGANIGGTASILGSPPNGLLAGAVAARGLESLSFVGWISQMLPLSLLMVPVVWFVLIFVFRGAFADRRSIKQPRFESDEGVAHWTEHAPMSSREKRVAAVFVIAVLLWCFVPFLPFFSSMRSEIDAVISLFIAFSLFVIPAGEDDKSSLLIWDDTKGVAWNILLLFGGGLALSAAFSSSGLSLSLASGLYNAGFDGGLLSRIGLLGGVLFATEVVSNTALAATIIPILLELESSRGLATLSLALPATIAVSLAFMMPIATPPNAIAYGVGGVPLTKMLYAGFILNCLSVLVLLAWFAP